MGLKVAAGYYQRSMQRILESLLYTHILQCNPGDEKLPWAEQEGKHTLLALESGRFRHAQLRWHTVDKEGFCFGVKLQDYAHWIHGSHHPAALFTDHRNLLAFFSDEARPATCTNPNRDRLTRWGLQLAGLKYEIHHISGVENRVADLGSRRLGNRFAKSKVTSTEGTLHGGPKPLLMRVLSTNPGTQKRTGCEKTRPGYRVLGVVAF